MIRNKTNRTPVIDLSGPQGNAYFLLGQAGQLARELGLDETAIVNQMRSSDYENLVQVFDQHFGQYVILER
jgi:hypothetical protein